MSLNFLRSYKTGVTGAILTASWDAFWLIGPPIGMDASGRRAYLIWGFCAFLLCVGQALYALIQENHTLKAALQPNLEIVFLPEDTYDSRPYLQTLEFVQPPMVFGDVASRMVDRRYRVGVKNLTSRIIPNVHVVLAKCDPPSNFVHVGHRLLVMDSDPPVGERDLPPSVNGEPSLWFDVANELDYADRTPKSFTFCYANPNIRGPVEYDIHHDDFSFTIRLRAEGGGVFHEREFRVWKDWSHQFHEHRALKMVSL
jgi:hypothetical protein